MRLNTILAPCSNAASKNSLSVGLTDANPIMFFKYFFLSVSANLSAHSINIRVESFSVSSHIDLMLFLIESRLIIPSHLLHK